MIKKIIITESGGVGILDVNRGDISIQVSDATGREEESIEKMIEEKDIKHIDKIKKDALKEIRVIKEEKDKKTKGR